MAIIYKIVHTLSGKIYVGHTCKSAARRFSQHKYRLNRRCHENIRLQNAWNKYGPGHFEFAVIEECDDSFKLVREQHFIDQLSPFYNIAKVAGSRLGVPQPLHVRELISRLNRLRDHKKPEGFGRTMSLALKGKPISEKKMRSFLAISHLGRIASPANKPGHVPKSMSHLSTRESRENNRQSFVRNEAKRRAAGIVKVWVTDGVAERKVHTSDEIPSGWRLGRKDKIGEVGKSRSGEKRSAATREKMRLAHLGKAAPKSEQWRDRHALAMKRTAVDRCRKAQETRKQNRADAQQQMAI